MKRLTVEFRGLPVYMEAELLTTVKRVVELADGVRDVVIRMEEVTDGAKEDEASSLEPRPATTQVYTDRRRCAGTEGEGPEAAEEPRWHPGYFRIPYEGGAEAESEREEEALRAGGNADVQEGAEEAR